MVKTTHIATRRGRLLGSSAIVRLYTTRYQNRSWHTTLSTPDTKISSGHPNSAGGWLLKSKSDLYLVRSGLKKMRSAEGREEVIHRLFVSKINNRKLQFDSLAIGTPQ